MGRQGAPAPLERDVVVQVAVERRGSRALLGARPATATATATAAAEAAAALIAAAEIVTATATAATAAVEKDELAAEALEDDFGRIAVGAGLVLPLARLDLALEIDLGALAQIGFGDAAEIFVEDDDAVPLGPLLALAVLVLPGLRRGDAQVHHLAAIVQRPALGVVPEIADQDDLVDARHLTCLRCKKLRRTISEPPPLRQPVRPPRAASRPGGCGRNRRPGLR